MADAVTDAAPDPAPRGPHHAPRPHVPRPHGAADPSAGPSPDASAQEVADEAFRTHVEGLVATWRLGEALDRLEQLPGIVPAVARQLLEDVVHRLHPNWPLHRGGDEGTLPAADEA